MDIYYEKNVINNSIERHKKRNAVLNVLRITCIVVTVALLIIESILPRYSVDDTGGMVAVKVIFSILIITAPLFIFWALTTLVGRLNAEFDYFIIDDKFRVVRVVNRKKRKRFIEFQLSRVSAMGTTDSEQFEKLTADREIKKVIAYCNDDELITYMYINDDGVKKLLLIEPDDEMLRDFKRILPISTFDASMKPYLAGVEKRTATKEEVDVKLFAHGAVEKNISGENPDEKDVSGEKPNESDAKEDSAENNDNHTETSDKTAKTDNNQ